MMMEKNNLWCKILQSKYKNRVPNSASTWWKDLHMLCFSEGPGSWFGECITRKVGNGEDVKFWGENWLGGEALKTSFSRLFSLSLQ